MSLFSPIELSNSLVHNRLCHSQCFKFVQTDYLSDIKEGIAICIFKKDTLYEK